MLFSQEMVLAWSSHTLSNSQPQSNAPGEPCDRPHNRVLSMYRPTHPHRGANPSRSSNPAHEAKGSVLSWRTSGLSRPRSSRSNHYTLSLCATPRALLPRSLVIAPIVVSPLPVESSRASIDTSELSLWSSCSPCVWVVARLVTRHQSIHSFHSATRVSACCTRAPSHSHTLSPNVR